MSPLFIKSSATYFWYFGILGLTAPFLAVFLDGKGFSSLQIGEILAIFTATKIFGPTIWAMLADKTGKQLSIIQMGAFLACLFFAGLIFVDTYWPVTFLLAMFSLFWTAILPQLEVMTLTSVRRSAKIYARIRLWGSIGFIVLAVASGEILSRYSSDAFSYIGLFVLISLYISTLFFKQPHIHSARVMNPSSIVEKLTQWGFVVFFLAGLLLQMSFGPFNGFFALYLRDLAYPSYAVGLLIAVGVIAEIAIFVYAGRLFQAFTVKSLLTFCMFISALRWYLVGEYGDNVWILSFTQLIHAAGFAIYHSASMQFIQLHFNANQQNRGQAVYIGGVYGIGGAIGAYITGALWQGGNGAQLAFFFAAATVLVAGILMLFLPHPKRPPIISQPSELQ
ncbi:MFS transporter [Colwelliaceae bacterium 6471]